MSSAATTEGASSRRARLIGKGWIQGVALVMLFGFTVMGLLATALHQFHASAAEGGHRER